MDTFFSTSEHDLPISSHIPEEDAVASQASCSTITTLSCDVAEVHDTVEMPKVVMDVLLAALAKYVDLDCQAGNVLENLGVASQTCKHSAPKHEHGMSSSELGSVASSEEASTMAPSSVGPSPLQSPPPSPSLAARHHKDAPSLSPATPSNPPSQARLVHELLSVLQRLDALQRTSGPLS
jgi:hypothetical protein